MNKTTTDPTITVQTGPGPGGWDHIGAGLWVGQTVIIDHDDVTVDMQAIYLEGEEVGVSLDSRDNAIPASMVEALVGELKRLADLPAPAHTKETP